MFDAKLREALPAALAARLCEPLLVAVVPRESKTTQNEMNSTLAEFAADGQLVPARAQDVAVESARIPWAFDLNGSGRAAAAHGRVLMAL